MKIKLLSVVASLCGMLAATAFGEDSRGKSDASSSAPAKEPPAPSASPSHPPSPASGAARAEAPQSAPEVAPPLSPAPPPVVTPDSEAAKANRAHIRKGPDPAFVMATPPPPLRAETKPLPPGLGLVWVPGHYMPVKKAWQWVAGDWGIPATPASVWIEGAYDPKTRFWSTGYWQPDRPQPPEAEAPPKAPPVPAKI